MVQTTKIRKAFFVVAVALLMGSFSNPTSRQNSRTSASGIVKRILYQVWTPKRCDRCQFYDVEFSDIYLKDGPKLKSRRIVEGGQSPSWSPDGKRIAYVGFGSGGMAMCRQLYVANPDGSGIKQITNLHAGMDEFSWSPVEEKIAYSEDRPSGGGQTAIMIVNEDGSGLKEVVVASTRCAPGFEYPLEWSPDGQKIAFTGCADGKPVIVVMGENGENAGTVVKGSNARWSPDGKRLLFIHGSESTPAVPGIWISNADGTEPERILDGESASFGLSWFPDGKGIAFGSKSENKKQSEIFRINTDGTGLAKIASTKGWSLSTPIFSPDGTKLVVDAETPFDGDGRDSQFSVLLIDMSGHGQERLAKGNYAGIIWGNR